MREFSTAFNGKVDLDNPETYKHLPEGVRKLDSMMFLKIGEALVYMDYFHPDIFPKKETGTKGNWHDNAGFYQRKRVEKLIKHFAENRGDNWENEVWFKEQIFVFEEETENMC